MNTPNAGTENHGGDGAENEPLAPSPWVVRFAGLVPQGGAVLDLACGGGRHSRLFLELGYKVVALDRDPSRLHDLKGHAALDIVSADLEDEDADLWAGKGVLAGRGFAGIIVTNYLHRPLLGRLVDALSEGGVLIYETFALGNERFGHPRNPDYLLRPGELLERARGNLQVIAYGHGFIAEPRRAVVQRLCAYKPAKEPAPALPLFPDTPLNPA